MKQTTRKQIYITELLDTKFLNKQAENLLFERIESSDINYLTRP